MELNSQSSPQENATFRKPMNDAGSRKYRRRSPVSGSSSSEGSPIHYHNSSPTPLRKDPEKGTDDQNRKDDARDLDRDSGRSPHGRSGDSHRHSDRQSSRISRSYHRHGDDYHRHDKYADDDRDYCRSSRSGRDARSNSYSNHSRRENDYRSRDHPHDAGKYSRDKSDGLGDKIRDKDRVSMSVEYQKHKTKDSSSDRAGSGRRHTINTNEGFKSGETDRYKEDKVGQDEKVDQRRSSWDYSGDHLPGYEDSRTHRNDFTSKRDSSGHQLKEAGRSGYRSMDGEKYTKEERKNHEGRGRCKECHHREAEKQYEDRKHCPTRDQESSAKKAKLFSLDESFADGKDVIKSKSIADEKQPLTLKEAQEPAVKGISEQALTDSDIDAAKIAAMKAAELVNQNLVGTGYMSTDQKKKLLWGSKKTTAVEESGHRWAPAIFGDHERQEKFNKLMGVKGDLKVEHKPSQQEEEKQRELQLDLEKQYTAGLRRRDGRTVGLGL